MSNRITYSDKIGLVAKKVHVTQWWDSDANEVKDTHNDLSDSVIGVSGVVISTLGEFNTAITNNANSKWYIIDEIVLTENKTIPAGVTLHFSEGFINFGSYVLTGTDTVINAGYYKIFDGTVKLAGTWNFTYAYPEWFGAVSDGVTNDTLAIQQAVSLQGSIVFQGGTYDVQFDDITTAYYNLFPIKSNTNIIFRNGALVKLSGTESATNTAIFGIDKNNLPVTNVNFIDVNIEGLPIETAIVNPIGIGMVTDSDDPADSITNINIQGGKLTSLAGGIYALQRTTSGVTTRQVNGVRITNVKGEGCISFISADGKDMDISGCSANGRSDLRTAFDGVSIHSGLNIKVFGNTFYNYDTGQVINVRNSPENLCGSADVIVSGNYIYDCPTTAIQISIQPDESVYGVQNVIVCENIIKNCTSGIFVTCGSGDTGTPFTKFTIDNNQIDDVFHGIWVANNVGLYATFVHITDNQVHSTATSIGSGIRVRACSSSVISGNMVRCASITLAINLDANLRPILTGGSELGVFPCYLDYFLYSTFENNWILTNEAEAPADPFLVCVITESTGITFHDNVIFGVWETGEHSVCDFKNNRWYKIGTNTGRVFNPNWEQYNVQIIKYDTAYPTSSLGGDWVVGDRIIDSTPVAGGFTGWICTVAGSPGTWKGYGLIEA